MSYEDELVDEMNALPARGVRLTRVEVTGAPASGLVTVDLDGTTVALPYLGAPALVGDDVAVLVVDGSALVLGAFG